MIEMESKKLDPQHARPAHPFRWIYIGWAVQGVIAAVSWVLYAAWPETPILMPIVWTAAFVGGIFGHYLAQLRAEIEYARLRAQYGLPPKR